MALLHPPTTVRPPSILTFHPLRPISTVQSRFSLPHSQTLKPPKTRLLVLTAVTSTVSTKEQTWTHEGVITDSLSNGMFKVELTNGEVILGHLSGKIRKNTIRVMTGDRVSVEVSRYDSSRGRIVFRLRADGTKGTPKKGLKSSTRKGPKGDRGN